MKIMNHTGMYAFTLLLIAGLFMTGAPAAVFNVTTPAGFQTALTTAQNNAEADTINVAAGTYNIAGTLTFSPGPGDDNLSLVIQGAGAGTTILDGGGTTRIMSLQTRGLATDGGADLTVRGLTFRNGSVNGQGGGLFADTDDAGVTLEDTIFVANTATNDGGGGAIETTAGPVTLNRNTFDSNTSGSGASEGGGGLYVNTTRGTLTLTDNVFSGNVAAVKGGGMYAGLVGGVTGDGLLNLTNNTFTGNTASGNDGGGIYVNLFADNNTANLYNNIIWGNTAGGSGNDAFLETNGDTIFFGSLTGATVNLFNNDYASLTVTVTDHTATGANINQDPLLTSDFHLPSLASPALDAGDNAAPALPATDFEGDSRILNGTVDMGADEVDSATTPTVDLRGTIKTTGGTDICAMVLASGQFMFSCDPIGMLSLSGLPRGHDGTVKRQIYADGFFPKIDILTGSVDEAVVLARSGACPSYNAPYSPAFVPGSAGNYIDISGKVLLQGTSTPVCALVLASGQHMFSCDGSGNYALNIPLDSNGQYKLQVYADGFAPTIQRFDEFQVINDVRMARATECVVP